MQKAFTLMALAGAALFMAHGLVAGPRPIDNHRTRWEYENQEWSEPKVMLNVQYRVPVIDTIGYLAVNFNEPQRLNQLLAKIRPIQSRVMELSQGTFQGRSFPAETETELDKLRTQMMSDVSAIYGDAATKQVEAYLSQKYSLADAGPFGGGVLR
ncbi:hypothetical protein H5P28_02500 [Ruficoccus amylovorans]|uniref:Uncharacterized protein n=1 Tax=Ruficoccus amylovorans TaxID=1804625 RepID=A0A842H9C9_9BACT|nr:hypothetical protein [Ruficoccus amylovorans]MBC2593123.1 hypothetical protein [Ruficoccus amylovorans]